MLSKPRPDRREKRPPKPLNPVRLNDLALHYVARFATSAAKLADYLRRKLRERGWEGDGDPAIAALVERFVAAGYVDDEAYARAKSGSLLRRGYGQRRVSQALGQAGIAEDLREEVRAGPNEQRAAAFAMAKKRRFGPFSAAPPDRPLREKQLAAMLRAGHPLDLARGVLGAATIEAAEAWAEEECE
ncbi:RecX family transcriptional regulator [Novosphingobium sp.]|uniref:regulatory protein RecX n=1 Tax=Novosphingobium sp. TaxID=1874826 RepID=UPI00286C5A58|nr:RecX family transcriptional regulator [Novosphingobium sp.]